MSPSRVAAAGLVDLMHLALGMNKSVLLLWPLYNNNRHKPAWQNVADSIQHFRDVAALIDDDRVVVVLAMCGKGGRGVPWWNKTENSVEHAFTWLFEPFIYKKIIFLPRQARDKHRENSPKKPAAGAPRLATCTISS